LEPSQEGEASTLVRSADVHEITVYEDGTIDTTDAAILCSVKPVSIRARIARGHLREVSRVKGQIRVYLLDVARSDRTMRQGAPRVKTEVSWRLHGEPDVDILTVFRACDELAQKAQPQEGRKHVVYYLRFGDRIKIGTTTCLVSRLNSLPHDEVLATEPGGVEVEDKRKTQFAEHRITGEWFRMTPALLRHIATLAKPVAC
jgi:hypothetical protein